LTPRLNLTVSGDTDMSLSLRRRHLLAAVPAVILPAWAGAATFPERPITLVVPFAPGGVADITARTVGQAMAATLGQAVVIDNKPGAGGIVATQAVLKAPADGYTLLMTSNATAVSVHLVKKLPYDVTKDLTPITTLGFFELGLAVAAESRFKTLKDLVAYAKANPLRWAARSICRLSCSSRARASTPWSCPTRARRR